MVYKTVRGLALRVLFPLLMLAGSFSRKKKEAYQRFIISLNNRLVKKEKLGIRKILLLLPHCLQINECDVRLTFNIYNCKKCGKCRICDLIRIADDNRISLFIATGGSLARRIVNDVKPGAVIAVACENDLSSGIADTFPLPVLGIPNKRPFGPCINTSVDLDQVKEAIEFLSTRYE
jgi:hypothetical protein